MKLQHILAAGALIFAVLSYFVAGAPLLAIAVGLLAVAMLLP